MRHANWRTERDGDFLYDCDGHCTYRNVLCASDLAYTPSLSRSIPLVVHIHAYMYL